MGVFKIGETDFGVGKVILNIDCNNSSIIDLTIEADEKYYESISDDEQSGWEWTIYPPKMYFYEVPFSNNDVGSIEVDFDDSVLERCDFALYFMEHNSISGKLIISNDLIRISGETSIMGKNDSLEISTSK